MKRLVITTALLAMSVLPTAAFGAKGAGGGGGGGVASTPPPAGADCFQWNEKPISIITARASIVMHGTGDLVNCSDHSVSVSFRETRTAANPDLSAPLVFEQGEPARPLGVVTIKPESKVAYEWFLTNPFPSSTYAIKLDAIDATTLQVDTSLIDEFVTPPA
jgi:hypothetical protein